MDDICDVAKTPRTRGVVHGRSRVESLGGGEKKKKSNLSRPSFAARRPPTHTHSRAEGDRARTSPRESALRSSLVLGRRSRTHRLLSARRKPGARDETGVGDIIRSSRARAGLTERATAPPGSAVAMESAMHPSKSCQDLIQAERPGFPAGLRVRAGIDASAVRVRPGRFRSPGSSSRTQPPISSEDGVSSFHSPPFDTPSLTVATPPSSSQVLVVMKDSARSTPAKKLLEDIGYKGASTAPRATRRDRGSSACTFLEGGLVPRSRFLFPSGHPPRARARAGRIAPRAPPAPAPRRRAPDCAPGTPRRPIARARRSQPGNARAPSPPPPARADRGIARRAANRRIRGGIFWVTTRDEPTTVHDPSNKNTLSRSAPGRRNKRSLDAPIRSLIPSLTLTATPPPPFSFASRS